MKTKPQKDETRQEFINRCMKEQEMIDYKRDGIERYKACRLIWEKNEK